MQAGADGYQQEVDGSLYRCPHPDDGERIVELYQEIPDDGIQNKAEETVCPGGDAEVAECFPKEYPLCCVSVSGNRTAVSIQQDTEIKIAAGSVNRPAVIRFWNLFVLIYKSNPISLLKYFFSKSIMSATR